MQDEIRGAVEALQSIGRRLDAEYQAMSPGTPLKNWRFREVQAICVALAALAKPAGGVWRPEVRAFADLMEAKLKANDHKSGWKSEMVWPLIERLREETDELHIEVDAGERADSDDWRKRVGNEAADVANFAMMIADVCGALPAPPTGKGD